MKKPATKAVKKPAAKKTTSWQNLPGKKPASRYDPEAMAPARAYGKALDQAGAARRMATAPFEAAKKALPPYGSSAPTDAARRAVALTGSRAGSLAANSARRFNDSDQKAKDYEKLYDESGFAQHLGQPKTRVSVAREGMDGNEDTLVMPSRTNKNFDRQPYTAPVKPGPYKTPKLLPPSGNRPKGQLIPPVTPANDWSALGPTSAQKLAGKKKLGDEGLRLVPKSKRKKGMGDEGFPLAKKKPAMKKKGK
jgi:hypothetical protein